MGTGPSRLALAGIDFDVVGRFPLSLRPALRVDLMRYQLAYADWDSHLKDMASASGVALHRSSCDRPHIPMTCGRVQALKDLCGPSNPRAARHFCRDIVSQTARRETLPSQTADDGLLKGIRRRATPFGDLRPPCPDANTVTKQGRAALTVWPVKMPAISGTRGASQLLESDLLTSGGHGPLRA